MPDFFRGEWCLEDKMWLIGVLVVPGMSLLLGLHSEQSKGIYICSNAQIYICVYFCIMYVFGIHVFAQVLHVPG